MKGARRLSCHGASADLLAQVAKMVLEQQREVGLDVVRLVGELVILGRLEVDAVERATDDGVRRALGRLFDRVSAKLRAAPRGRGT